MIVESVKCDKCDRLHPLDADSFIVVEGNVYKGLQGGLIGNNFDEDGKVTRKQAFCFPNCIAEVLQIPTGAIRR